MKIIKLENELNDLLDSIGLKFSREIDSKKICKFVLNKNIDDIKDECTRNEILRIVIRYVGEGIKIVDFTKLFKIDLPVQMEKDFSRLMKHITIGFNDKKEKRYYCKVAYMAGLYKNYQELFPYISVSWELMKSFADKKDLDNLASKELVKFLVNKTRYIRIILDIKIPDIVFRYVKEELLPNE